jgi:hypothetical protein
VSRGQAPVALTLALVVVLAACGGSTAPTAGGPKASPLAAGTYTSQVFTPALTFTVPAGWEVATDSAAYFQLRPQGSDQAGIHVFRDVAALSQDPACPTKPEALVGRTSSQLVAWMRSLKGLVVGQPAMVTIGGQPGISVDVGIAAGWTQSCSFANGLPTVPLLTDGTELRWVMAGNERLRLYILDRPGGGNLVVDLDAFDGSLIDALVSNGVPVVTTFKFAPG